MKRMLFIISWLMIACSSCTTTTVSVVRQKPEDGRHQIISHYMAVRNFDGEKVHLDLGICDFEQFNPLKIIFNDSLTTISVHALSETYIKSIEISYWDDGTNKSISYDNILIPAGRSKNFVLALGHLIVDSITINGSEGKAQISGTTNNYLLVYEKRVRKNRYLAEEEDKTESINCLVFRQLLVEVTGHYSYDIDISKIRINGEVIKNFPKVISKGILYPINFNYNRPICSIYIDAETGKGTSEISVWGIPPADKFIIIR